MDLSALSLTRQTIQSETTTLDESKVVVASANINVSCTSADYSYEIIGYRHQSATLVNTDDYYLTASNLFKLTAPASGITLIRFNPTYAMRPGHHEVAIMMKYKYYKRSNSAVPFTAMLYYEKRYDNECAVDIPKTQNAFILF